MKLCDKKLFVIGCGNMGGAIIQALKDIPLKSKAFYDIDIEKGKKIESLSGFKFTQSIEDGLSSSDAVLLAIKPQQADEFLKEIASLFTRNHLIISILAGIPIDFIQKRVNIEVEIVRAMPNTPALINEGLTAICGGEEDAIAIAEELFSVVGEVIRVEESQMDAITALSGAGPAYVYAFLESFLLASDTQGFTNTVSEKIVFKTVSGAIKLLLESGEHPSILRKKVTSPGGVTEAALKKMDSLGLSELLTNGVKSGVKRSLELGNK